MSVNAESYREIYGFHHQQAPEQRPTCRKYEQNWCQKKLFGIPFYTIQRVVFYLLSEFRGSRYC